MKLKEQDLQAHLKKPLLPVYLVSGDEPYQLLKATDSIREAATAQGFTERTVFHVDTSFDWSELSGEAAAMSLFAERKLLDLRMPSGKPGREGGKAIQAYCANPSADNVLLIRAGKLDRSAKSSAWVKALDKLGAWVEVWDKNPAQTLQFVGQQLQQAGFQADRDAVKVLTERVEGNLLAASQEIEKLKLIRDPGPIDAATIKSLVADSARYDPFELIDAALLGDTHRTIKMLWGLKGEGAAVNQVLWSVSRDVRILADFTAMRDAGNPADVVLRQVWGNRQQVLQRAAGRHSPERWARLLRRCIELDQLVKGILKGDAWDELLQLLMWIAGKPALRADRCDLLPQGL